MLASTTLKLAKVLHVYSVAQTASKGNTTRTSVLSMTLHSVVHTDLSNVWVVALENDFRIQLLRLIVMILMMTSSRKELTQEQQLYS